MSGRALAAVGVRIGTKSTPIYELHRRVMQGHWERGDWETNNPPKPPWPVGTPVIASLFQTVKFTLGEVAGEVEKRQTAGRWKHVIPVTWEPVVYLGDTANNPVLRLLTDQNRTGGS